MTIKRIRRTAVALALAAAAVLAGGHLLHRPNPCTWQYIAKHGQAPECHGN